MKIVIRTKGPEYRIGDVGRNDQWDIINNIQTMGPKFFGKSEVCKSRGEANEKWGNVTDVVDCGYVAFPK